VDSDPKTERAKAVVLETTGSTEGRDLARSAACCQLVLGRVTGPPDAPLSVGTLGCVWALRGAGETLEGTGVVGAERCFLGGVAGVEFIMVRVGAELVASTGGGSTEKESGAEGKGKSESSFLRLERFLLGVVAAAGAGEGEAGTTERCWPRLLLLPPFLCMFWREWDLLGVGEDVADAWGWLWWCRDDRGRETTPGVCWGRWTSTDMVGGRGAG
jgi:hypothetical protein